jgi:hypothetical protein
MQFVEAKQALARKLDVDYTNIALNGLFTDSDFSGLIQFALQRAWDYKPWPFTVKVKTAPTSASADFYDYPTDLMNGSAYILIVGGKEYKKLTIEDYLRVLQCEPDSVARIWSENGTFIFINKNAYTPVTDSFDVYGRGIAPELVNTTDLLPFSPTNDNSQYSGNEAIVQLAYSEALDSEKKKNPQAAEVERKKAYQTLDLLWKPFADQKANMQARRPLFDVPSYFWRGYNPTGYPIGNFPFWDGML